MSGINDIVSYLGQGTTIVLILVLGFLFANILRRVFD